MGSGELTLEDFLEQMLAIRKMGPIGNLLGMLPGAGQMKDALAEVDDKQLDRLQAIITRDDRRRSGPTRRSCNGVAAVAYRQWLGRGGVRGQPTWSTASSKPAR